MHIAHYGLPLSTSHMQASHDHTLRLFLSQHNDHKLFIVNLMQINFEMKKKNTGHIKYSNSVHKSARASTHTVICRLCYLLMRIRVFLRLLSNIEIFLFVSFTTSSWNQINDVQNCEKKNVICRENITSWFGNNCEYLNKFTISLFVSYEFVIHFEFPLRYNFNFQP